MDIDFDSLGWDELRRHLRDDASGLRADAACHVGDRLRTRRVHALPEDIRERLAAMLEDGAPMVAFEAAMALAEAHDPRATDLLLAAVHNRTVRLDAIRALGTLGDPRAIEPLERLMRRWLLPWADRLQAAAALCALGNDVGATYLKERLHSRRKAERAAAMHFVGEARHPEAFAILRQLLLNPDEPMRDTAARALGWLDDPAAIPLLRGLRASAELELLEDIDAALARLELSTTTQDSTP